MSARPLTRLPLLTTELGSMMPDDLKELLRAFNDHAVKFLIGGGMLSAFTQSREQPRIWIFLSDPTRKTAKQYFARSHNTARLSVI